MHAVCLISDRSLIERLRQGEHAAFEETFTAYYVDLCAFAYRYLRSQAMAEEAVHDVFMKIWRARDALLVRDSLKAYLYAAVRHRTISLLRRQTLERHWRAGVVRDELAAPAHSRNAGPEQLEREQVAAAIEQVLATLPTRCRAALVLRWQRDMSYAEIAEAMDISVKTVEVYLTRAFKALRTHLPPLLAEPPDR